MVARGGGGVRYAPITPTVRRCAREGCNSDFTAKTTGGRYCPSCRWTLRGKPRKWGWTAHAEAVLRRRYVPGCPSGTLKQIAADLGLPANYLSKRAQALGLRAYPVKHPWTAEEDAFLDEWAGTRSAEWMAGRLPGRSLAATINRLRHRGVSRAIREGYTRNSLAQCFGVTPNEVGRWIRLGYLTGTRRTGGDAPAYEGDYWTFTDMQVLNFVREHPTAFPLATTDQTWFLDLVFNNRAHGNGRKATAA